MTFYSSRNSPRCRTWVLIAHVPDLSDFVQDGFDRGKGVRSPFDGVVPQPDVRKTAVYQLAGHHFEAHVGQFFLRCSSICSYFVQRQKKAKRGGQYVSSDLISKPIRKGTLRKFSSKIQWEEKQRKRMVKSDCCSIIKWEHWASSIQQRCVRLVNTSQAATVNSKEAAER